MGRRHTHRTLALAALVLWLAGVELVPNVHLALHDALAEHVHEGDVMVFAHGHVHRAISTHRGARAPRDKRAADRDLALRLAHGAHSLAHHAAALQPAPVPILAPLPVDRRPLILAECTIVAPGARPLPHANARGPPVA
jgi:hypothetical protein